MIERNDRKKAPSLLRRKLRGRGGYSLGEALVALVILMLVSSGMVETIRFAIDQYHKQVTYSEAKVLCSTLTNVIRGELSNTSHIKLSGSNNLDSFFSPNYSIDGIGENNKVSFYAVDVAQKASGLSISDAAGAGGELLLGKRSGSTQYTGNLLLSSASYSTYRLRAGVPLITYSGGVFSVTLDVYSSDDKLLVENKFDVLPLNTPTIDT